MKEKYMKPEIVFECFSLSTNIAGSCEKLVPATYGSCGYETSSGYTVFLEGLQGCDFEVEDSSSLGDGYCYHNPTDDKNMFTS